MSKNSKPCTISLSPENIERLELIAERLKAENKTNFANKSASADLLIEYGYHTYHLMNREVVPLIDVELLDQIDQIALMLHEAKMKNNLEKEQENDV